MIKIQEDTELIQNILNDNPQAQKTLYEKYSKLVKYFLIKKYPTCSDYDDDISEIMIKVFTKLKSFDINKSKFKSWVFGIAKNHMIDKWRSDTITLTGSNTNHTFSYSTTATDTTSGYITSNNIGTIDINNCSYTTNTCGADYDFENCSSISYIADQLTPQDYTLLDMKYIQGYNYAEIGIEFNVTSSTISNRVNYIKTKLKKNNPEIIYK